MIRHKYTYEEYHKDTVVLVDTMCIQLVHFGKITLHQATLSEKLVDLFHSAGHVVGIDTIRRIDSSIANEILEEFENNGYVYIPQGIMQYAPGRLIVGSFDNIDVLEETIDGKNTFHCTQMVL
jgi:hypothetical protein